jgi:hypothetical protein
MTMPDLSEDLRTYFDELASQLDRHLDAIDAPAPGPRHAHRGLVIAVAVIGVVVLVGATLVVTSQRQNGVGVRTGPATTSAVPDRTRILYTHRSPDGSVIIARVGVVTIPATVTCTTQGVTPPGCGQGPGHTQTGPGIAFDYVIDGRHYHSIVLDSDARLVPSPSDRTTTWSMVPLFGSSDTIPPTGQNLIILHTTGQVAEVRLTSSGPGGASPKGDQMAPVDGWVTFPIHNFIRLERPEALDSQGHALGTSLPFPCC